MLTEEERRLVSHDGHWMRPLTLIDALTAKCDAQAQTIERVRLECLRACPDGHGSVNISTARLWPALAAAPEHTTRNWAAFDPTEALHFANARMAKLARRLDEALAEIRERAGEANAANARVAELEGQYETSHRSRLHAEECLRAANARIAELETACREYRGLLKAAYDAERTAEDEVGKLRAEVERLRREAEEWKANWQNATQLVETHRRDALNEAAHAIASEDRLAAAHALLRQVQASSRGRRWVKRIDAFLSTAPALTEHEAAERKVLEAMAAVPEETLRRSAENATHAPEHSRAPALAELALRAVKP